MSIAPRKLLFSRENHARSRRNVGARGQVAPKNCSFLIRICAFVGAAPTTAPTIWRDVFTFRATGGAVLAKAPMKLRIVFTPRPSCGAAAATAPANPQAVNTHGLTGGAIRAAAPTNGQSVFTISRIVRTQSATVASVWKKVNTPDDSVHIRCVVVDTVATPVRTDSR
jgi:hypothetical protein